MVLTCSVLLGLLLNSFFEGLHPRTKIEMEQNVFPYKIHAHAVISFVHYYYVLNVRNQQTVHHYVHVYRLVQWVLDYPNPNYPYADFWTSAPVTMFLVRAGKRRCGHWSFATGENKAAVRTTFSNATTLFPWSMGFRLQFTTSELAERSRQRCSTL